ncbi:MAG: hypothetical protein OEV43_08045, partial [Coriobacteriia bacterium]|nr:hypothetical protein [Coriobacteriia bacterium]
MEQRTKITLAVVAGLIGAFILGGIAFAVTGPVLRGIGVATFGTPQHQARDGVGAYRDGSRSCWEGDFGGPARGTGEMGRLGRMGPRGNLQSPRDPDSASPPRLQGAP